MMNAAEPITGGVICPPREEAASVAPARAAGIPVFFIRGMVITPVVATLDVEEPESIANIEDATTAIFAGPPTMDPNTPFAILSRRSARPVAWRAAPKSRNIAIYVEETPIGVDQIPTSAR